MRKAKFQAAGEAGRTVLRHIPDINVKTYVALGLQ